MEFVVGVLVGFTLHVVFLLLLLYVCAGRLDRFTRRAVQQHNQQFHKVHQMQLVLEKFLNRFYHDATYGENDSQGPVNHEDAPFE